MDTEKAKEISKLYEKLKEFKKYYSYLKNEESRIGSIDLYLNGRKEVLFIGANDDINSSLKPYLKQIYAEKIKELEEEIKGL